MIKPKRSAEQQIADDRSKGPPPSSDEADNSGQPSRSGISGKSQTPESRAVGARGGAEGEGEMTNGDGPATGPGAHVNFDAPATLRKWPSLDNQRRTEGTG